MYRILLSLIFTISCIAIQAQSSSYIYKGGFGHFYTGPAWLEPTDLINYYKSPEVLGPSFDWHNVGVITGGEGFAEFNRLLIGGGGFGLILPVMNADNARVRFGMGAGGLKVGYVFTQNDYYFASMNAGFGGGGYYTGIKNNGETNINFDKNDPIRPDEEKDYFMGFLMYDFSISNKWVASGPKGDRQKVGGFMLGLDLGATIQIPVDEWRTDYYEYVDAVSPGTVISPFIRLTIGGGGFRKKPYATPTQPAVQE